MRKKSMKNTENESLDAIFQIVNRVRKDTHPDIPEQIILDILDIEMKYVNEHDRAYPKIRQLLEDDLKKFDEV